MKFPVGYPTRKKFLVGYPTRKVFNLVKHTEPVIDFGISFPYVVQVRLTT